MPLPLIPIVLGASNLLRMVAPTVAKKLIKRGVARASKKTPKKNIPRATKQELSNAQKEAQKTMRAAQQATRVRSRPPRKSKPKQDSKPKQNSKPKQDSKPTKLTKTQKVALGTAGVAIPTYLATRGEDAKNVREGFDKILNKGQKKAVTSNNKKQTKPIAPIKKKPTKLDSNAIRKADAQTADEVGAKKMKPVSPKPNYNERLGPREQGKTITTKKKTAAEKYGPFSEEAGKEWFKKNLGIDVTYEYPEDPDSVEAMKKGGRIKKKTKIKKRAALRGYGKALRGF